MSALLLTCPNCGWERVAMSPRADAKARQAHAEKCEKDATKVVAPAPVAPTRRRAPAPRKPTGGSSWDTREEWTWIDKM